MSGIGSMDSCSFYLLATLFIILYFVRIMDLKEWN